MNDTVHIIIDTHHIINEKSLSLMKPESLLVNTSRGSLIDSEALLAALNEKRIGGAALDVYEEETDLFYIMAQNIAE